MHGRISVALVFLTLVSLGAQLEAQVRDTTHTFCWTAHPAPNCRLFLVTNFGAYATTSYASAYGDRSSRFAADWGVMANASDHDALGVSYFASIRRDVRSVEGGLQLRYRRWISARSSVEVGLGLLESSPFTMKQVRAALMLKYSPAAWLGFAVRASSRSTLLGVEIGSVPGLVLTAVAAPVLGGVALGNRGCC